jgi:hypothetical protein
MYHDVEAIIFGSFYGEVAFMTSLVKSAYVAQ